MSRYVLIPGAGGSAWYWHRVVPLLRQAGHEAIAVDLPGPDPDAGLAAYTDLVVSAVGGHEDLVLVAASLGGFTVPIRVAAGAGDRFFPAAFQQQVARDRLGIEADVLPGGHLIALAQPVPLTDYLLAV
jgi:pimeloyl-ACP methyl ester carboxylesterase